MHEIFKFHSIFIILFPKSLIENKNTKEKTRRSLLRFPRNFIYKEPSFSPRISFLLGVTRSTLTPNRLNFIEEKSRAVESMRAATRSTLFLSAEFHERRANAIERANSWRTPGKKCKDVQERQRLENYEINKDKRKETHKKTKRIGKAEKERGEKIFRTSCSTFHS